MSIERIAIENITSHQMEISTDKYPTTMVPIVLLYLLYSEYQEADFAFHGYTRHLDVVGKVTSGTVT